MTQARVNYDLLAPGFHQRYRDDSLPGITAALRATAQRLNARRVLEVGCGTGRWLDKLGVAVPERYGLDFSEGMVREAGRRFPALHLTNGEAGDLPFATGTLDWVFCVTALHHFLRPPAFIVEAHRLLRPGGALTIINLDPHANRDQWYVYDYFERTRALDLSRFPSAGQMLDWVCTTGFDRVEWGAAQRLDDSLLGRAVLSNYFLQKESTSQLTLLTDDEYAHGLARLHAAVEAAEANGQTAVFPVTLHFYYLTAFR